MRHRPSLVRAHLGDRQTESHGHVLAGSGRAGLLAQAVAQPDDGGEPQRQMFNSRVDVVGRIARYVGSGDVHVTQR